MSQLPKDPAILHAARALIADPTHWTQQSFARDAKGLDIGFLHPIATRFCGIGALYRVCNGLTEVAMQLVFYLNNIANNHYGKKMLTLNDNFDHAAVLDVYDKAIEGYDQWRQDHE